MTVLRRVLPIIVALHGAIFPAAAQSPQTRKLSVNVRIADTSGAPIPEADVSVIRGLQEVLAHATTDARGRASLSVNGATGDLQVSARKIGYTAAAVFFVAPATASKSFEVTLHRAVQSLAPVAVTAQEDVKRKSYYIDADQIAESTRPLFNAMDIVTKLRPDIMTGRSPGCGVKDVWVNGRRILFPPPNEMVTSRIPRRPPTPKPQQAMQSSGSGRPLPTAPMAMVNADVWLILASIKPEHIAELTYEDCFSTKVAGTHASQAVFVVLKPGVGYEPGVGSYVISNPDSLIGRKAPVQRVATAPASVPSYRARVLGVFDDSSGDPVADAVVTDSASGTQARTTTTGTISLVFLPEGLSTLFVRKPGFSSLRVAVTIAPTDSSPLTLVLSRAKSPLLDPFSGAPTGAARTRRPGAAVHSLPREH